MRICPLSFRKKWGFFGQKVWKKYGYPNFTLKRIIIADDYTEVEIEVNYLIDVGRGSVVETDFDQPKEFEKLRPEFERVLANFFARLS